MSQSAAEESMSGFGSNDFLLRGGRNGVLHANAFAIYIFQPELPATIINGIQGRIF